MKTGDVIKDRGVILTFTSLCPLDEEVAQTWAINCARNSQFLKDGCTPMERPMKDWVPGAMVIVAHTLKVLGILRTPKGYVLMEKI